MAATVAQQQLLLEEAMKHYHLPTSAGGVTFSPTSGGVNNVVFYVSSANDGALIGVLRVYNNGNDDAKVKYEHAVLSQLHLHHTKLSFEIPTVILTTEQQPFVKLSNGASAALFQPIPGGLPGNTRPYAIGKASGELSAALATVDLTQMPPICPNFPYYDLYKVHHAVTRDSFFDTMRSSVFDPWRPFADKVCTDIAQMEQKIELWNTSLNFPKQLIHGDLHYDNVLLSPSSLADGTDTSTVTGLLDFEFAAMDWRAMELAICLSKYAGEANPLEYFVPFIEGFAVHGRLTIEEINAICDLIILRILSNVVYFVGRSIAQEDDISTLTKRIETYCKRIDWVTLNAKELGELMTSKFIRP
jgi:homoserine kinase type II